MYNLNTIKHLQFIEDKGIASITESDLENDKKKAIKTHQFNESILGIKSSLEKLQAYIVKSNNEYERRLKESTSS